MMTMAVPQTEGGGGTHAKLEDRCPAGRLGDQERRLALFGGGADANADLVLKAGRNALAAQNWRLKPSCSARTAPSSWGSCFGPDDNLQEETKIQAPQDLYRTMAEIAEKVASEFDAAGS